MTSGKNTKPKSSFADALLAGANGTSAPVTQSPSSPVTPSVTERYDIDQAVKEKTQVESTEQAKPVELLSEPDLTSASAQTEPSVTEEQNETPQEPVSTPEETSGPADEAPAEPALVIEPVPVVEVVVEAEVVSAEVVQEALVEEEMIAQPGLVLTGNETITHLEGGGFVIDTADGPVEVQPNPAPIVPKSIAEVNQVVIDEIESELNRILTGVSPSTRMPFIQIQQYLEAMAPQQIVTLEEGMRQQATLFSALQQILNGVHADDQFATCMTALLRVFDLAKDGSLHDSNVFRYLEHVTLKKDSITAFTRWVNMLSVTANVKSRKTSLKQIDFAKALQFGLTDAARRRILDFYGI